MELALKEKDLALRMARLQAQEAQWHQQQSVTAIAALKQWHNSGGWNLSGDKLRELRRVAGDALPSDICVAIRRQIGGYL